MKKKFYPLSAVFLFLEMPLLFGIMAVGVWFTYRIIEGMIDYFKPASIFGLILGLAIFLVGAILLIKLLRHRLFVFDDRIGVKGELKLTAKSRVIQHDVEIFFDEIENIELICRCEDSKGRYRKSYTSKGSSASFFYRFKLKNGKTKRLYIEPYSRRQRKQLLAIINERTGHNFSYETLERRDESMFARKKKK